MTNEQKYSIRNLRESGLPISSIAKQLGISANTVKSYCQRHNIHPLTKQKKLLRFCLQCHAEIPQTQKRKAKKFCCDKCRQMWWKEHSSMIRRSSQIELICPVCGKTFQTYKSKQRKYCSRICYGKSKGVSHERRDVS